MFNINSLAQGFGHVYNSKKRRIVRAMKRDRNESWKQRGQRFEVFRPKHENPEPSEWYIPLYAFRHPGVVMGWSGSTARIPETRNNRKQESPPSNRLAKFTGLLRKRKHADGEKGMSDEGWVM